MAQLPQGHDNHLQSAISTDQMIQTTPQSASILRGYPNTDLFRYQTQNDSNSFGEEKIWGCHISPNYRLTIFNSAWQGLVQAET